jgi:hypothetical protein
MIIGAERERPRKRVDEWVPVDRTRKRVNKKKSQHDEDI